MNATSKRLSKSLAAGLFGAAAVWLIWGAMGKLSTPPMDCPTQQSESGT